MKGFCNLSGILRECHEIRYLGHIMRQKMQFRKVKIALLADVVDYLLPLYSVFYILFCQLCQHELEILVDSCLFSLALKDLLKNLCCLITISLRRLQFGKNVLRLKKH